MSRSWTSSRKRQIQRQLSERDGGSFCHYCDIELAIQDEMPTKGSFFEYDNSWDCQIGEDILPLWQKSSGYYILPSHIKPAVIEHKTPLILGGSNHLDNLVLACMMCNSRKCAIPYKEYMALIKGDIQ